MAEDKTFTQDEVDQIVKDRLERESKKFSDYDELKAKVGEYEKTISEKENQISTMTSDHEKQIAERDAKIQTLETDSLKTRIALEAGLPADLAERLQGTDEASFRADAQKLVAYAKPQNQTPPPYNPEPEQKDPTRASYAKMLAEMKQS
ncbi:MAG: DUF4355 domain-containing protein [Bacteroidales bacterium]|nr:DUF4355 domain-containing protein [Bacteroidales bacterium]